MPKDMTSIRHERLSRIMALFQSKTKVSHDTLKAVGEYASERTLQNDLHFLRETYGAEIEYSHYEKLYIMIYAGTFHINLKVTNREVEALTAGLKMASHFLPHLEKDAESLWNKLGNYIPSEVISWGADLARATVMAAPVAPVKAEVFNVLQEARHKKSTVNINYVAPGRESRVWLLSPYDIYFRGSAWYVVSYNHRHKNLGIHRLSRITRATLASEPYVPPEESGFTDDYVPSAWHINPGLEKHFIKLRISNPLADTLREIQWHPTQKIEEEPDGDIVLTAEVPHLDEVARWVLAGAPGVHVIEPDELKTMVREFAEKAIADL